MCQSYRKPCACGQKTSEIFFGKMVLDEAAVRGVYCPQCSSTVDLDTKTMVPDNGWVLELDADVIAAFAPRMEMTHDDVTAEKVFDADYVTWVGFSPEDNRTRSEERTENAKRFECDLKQGMKKRTTFNYFPHYSTIRDVMQNPDRFGVPREALYRKPKLPKK